MKIIFQPQKMKLTILKPHTKEGNFENKFEENFEEKFEENHEPFFPPIKDKTKDKLSKTSNNRELSI